MGATCSNKAIDAGSTAAGVSDQPLRLHDRPWTRVRIRKLFVEDISMGWCRQRSWEGICSLPCCVSLFRRSYSDISERCITEVSPADALLLFQIVINSFESCPLLSHAMNPYQICGKIGFIPITSINHHIFQLLSRKEMWQLLLWLRGIPNKWLPSLEFPNFVMVNESIQHVWRAREEDVWYRELLVMNTSWIEEGYASYISLLAFSNIDRKSVV